MTPEQIVTEYFGSYEGGEELSPTQVRARLIERITAYGAECAARERERCARIVDDWASVPGSDLDDLATALRNLD